MGELLFTLALIWGVFFLAEWSVKDTNEYKLGKQAKPLIELCEKNLPRNQKCELTAAPKGVKK